MKLLTHVVGRGQHLAISLFGMAILASSEASAGGWQIDNIQVNYSADWEYRALIYRVDMAGSTFLGTQDYFYDGQYSYGGQYYYYQWRTDGLLFPAPPNPLSIYCVVQRKSTVIPDDPWTSVTTFNGVWDPDA